MVCTVCFKMFLRNVIDKFELASSLCILDCYNTCSRIRIHCSQAYSFRTCRVIESSIHLILKSDWKAKLILHNLIHLLSLVIIRKDLWADTINLKRVCGLTNL